MSIIESKAFSIAPGYGGRKSWNPIGAEPTLYAIGVPHPSENFGYNPLTKARRADPAEWPSTEDALGEFYYIDDSHVSASDSNVYGCPDAPRLTLPTGVFEKAGTTFIVGGGGPYSTGLRYDMAPLGTREKPAFLLNESGGAIIINSEIRVAQVVNVGTLCTHFIIDGFSFPTETKSPTVKGPGKYITFRNMTCSGSGTNVGNNSVLYCQGDDNDNRAENIVFYNNLIENFGDKNALTENDYHGILPGEYCSNVWVLDNVSRDNGGDSIQIGQAGFSGLQRPDHIYVTGNDFSGDRENCVDVKSAVDVIITQNILSDNEERNSSTGENIVIHDDCERVWVMYNDISVGQWGVSCTGGNGIYVIANTFREMFGTVDFVGPFFERNTACHFTSATNCHFIYNSIYDSVMGVDFVGGSTTTPATIACNIFPARQDVNGWDILIESSDLSNVTMDKNIHQDFRARIGSTDYETSVAFDSGAGITSGAINGDPLYTNPVAGDLSLQAGSPAIDQGDSEAAIAILDLFEATYGISIKNFDMLGVDRTINPDAGALERV